MSSTVTNTANFIQGEVKARIDKWIANYPADQKKSATMPALRIVQECHHGYLTTDLMDQIAEYLEITPMEVYEVATFYGNYEHEPVGEIKLCVCNSISCMLRGRDEILAAIEKKIGIKPGEMTEDGRFSVKMVECLGACGGAPMMQVGKVYHENLTPENITDLLEEWSK
ncbi:complex I 24 kDa subunit family protein [Thiomicrorhabdus sediminis]|uniref:NADH-quinone oxidoreductase subunit E n=1 Tax=Thiomicrorhabdus sediminis TaxID=2580412 RepID=A0A4P9K486_9GAMM|nr:NAD(P)H-dependent oxidoreductase subunit E [Thiomicrorhabdus sediminis]QCU89764.1 NAD(P)H-dependent oxidoreductase subunit E [Thiomicrorhabdus sediminis]